MMIKKKKKRLKIYVENKMMDRLLRKREDDIIRVVEVRNEEIERKKRSSGLLRWYLHNTGTDNGAPPLSVQEMDAIQETWKDIWNLGIIDPEWFRMYAYKTGKFDPTYIPSDLHYFYVEWNKIDFDYLRGFLDKNYMDVLLPIVKHPPVLVRKIHGIYLDSDFHKIGLEDAVDLIYENRVEGAVIKISIASCGGSGVSFVDSTSTKEDIYTDLQKSCDIHVEKIVHQHPEMDKMNPTSINTIRIITMMIDGESVPLSACVRIGNSGSRVDNFSSGGVGCGIRPDGTLNDFGFTQVGDRMECHPNGFRFADGKVPNFEHVLDVVKRLHYYVPVFGVANWDICIDPAGDPMLIEYNVGGGGIDIHQYNNGPLYGSYREKIIAEIFEDFAFKDGNASYNYLVDQHKVGITNGSYHIAKLRIPSQLSDKPVRVICSEAFAKRFALETVIIDADLDEIQYCAFYRCRQLKKVVFHGKVRHIGRAAFSTCPELKEVRLPEGTETIGIRAFRDCKALQTVYIPASVQEIGEEAFFNCSHLTVYTPAGSFADQYTRENQIPVKNT